MYICFSSQIVVFGLLDMAYLDHDLHLCQFIKFNISLSTPNPNKCQKYNMQKMRCLLNKFA